LKPVKLPGIPTPPDPYLLPDATGTREPDVPFRDSLEPQAHLSTDAHCPCEGSWQRAGCSNLWVGICSSPNTLSSSPKMFLTRDAQHLTKGETTYAKPISILGRDYSWIINQKRRESTLSKWRNTARSTGHIANWPGNNCGRIVLPRLSKAVNPMAPSSWEVM
jgi:hypothetical protein